MSAVLDTVWRTGTLIKTDTVRLVAAPVVALASVSSARHAGGGVLDHLPVDGDKPDPVAETYLTCPDIGSDPGNRFDSVLNRRKNRIDVPRAEDGYIDATPGAVVENKPTRQLPKYRDDWSDLQAAWVAKWEGEAVTVEGYLTVDRRPSNPVYGAKQEGEESTNCEDDAPNVDFHIWLTPDASEDRIHAIVVEMTPRIRNAHHDGTRTLTKLEAIAKDKIRVRVSGWLLYDQEHKEQLGKTRATLWEIHPIMEFAVEDANVGRFVPLDDWQP